MKGWILDGEMTFVLAIFLDHSKREGLEIFNLY